ncbi:MAG: hypothetical protein COA58_04255 [Bacteroidetes bacterium]|nr:MAG: hypothetical protein COA58_04255 [Bacteroidota bacterium]
MNLPNKKLCLKIIFSLLLWIISPCQLFSQTQIGTDFNGASEGEKLGSSVAITSDGSRVVIGALGNVNSRGYVVIYDEIQGNWQQVGDQIDGISNGGEFGSSVSISDDGKVVVIGSVSYDEYRGAIQVYKLANGNWTQVGANIYGEAQGDEFGLETSISGDGSIIAAGGPGNSNNAYASGQVKIYSIVNGNVITMGKAIEGHEMRDEVGGYISLSSDGGRIAISGAGSIRIYDFISGSWRQVGDNINDGLTVSMSDDGNRLVAGVDESVVKVFDYVGGNWEQVGSTLYGETSEDAFGRDVAISADGLRLAVGAGRNDENGIDAGHVRIFDFKNGLWTRVGQDIDGDAAVDRIGEVISLSGDGETIIIGTIFNDEKGSFSGQARVFNLEGLMTNSIIRASEHILLSPNPTSGVIVVEGLEPKEVRIFNCFGQVVFTKKLSRNEIDISHLVSGIYVVQLMVDGELFSKSVVKR